MQNKLSISKVLTAVNNRNRKFYSQLSAEEQKQFNGFIVMRYVSNPDVGAEVQEWFIEKTHQYVNRHFWQLYRKHPELIWNLYASIGVGAACRYEYINSTKTTVKNKTVKLLSEYYPIMKMDDVHALAAIMSEQDIQDLIDQQEPN